MDPELRKNRTKAIYNGIAPYYDRLRLLLKSKDIPTVLNLLDINETDRVLDAGMGPGVYTFEMLKRKKLDSVIGVDISDKFVNIATKKAQKKNYSNVSFRMADIENLPFVDHMFDKIICSGVLLIVPNREETLGELYRVLKPGGRIVFVEPLNETFVGKEIFYVFGNIFIRFLAMKNPEMKGVNRFDFAGSYFGEQELYSLLNRGGFNDVKVVRNRIEVYGVCNK